MPADLTPKQQFAELVKNAGSVLLLTHENPDGDALGSILALKMGLEKLGKEVTAAVGGAVPAVLSFLPQRDTLKDELRLNKDLLIVLDENQAKVGNVTLRRLSETKLVVVVSPKDGVLTAGDVRIEEGSFTYDLVIVLDCSDLERLGETYRSNADLFYELPIVNVDHHSTNVNFGKVNIVDLTASSTAEILVSLLETIGKDMPGIIDADMATCLLTGIITDTSSFQNANTTPKSLTVAAQMVAAGARQQEIIQQVYKTRSLGQLRLWGRALAYIKEDREFKFAWSTLTRADFVAAQATDDAVQGVVDELLKTAAGMDFVVLLYERADGVKVSFRAISPTTNVADLAAIFGGGGHPMAAAGHMDGMTLVEAEQQIVNQIRAHLTGATPIPAQPQPTAQPERPVRLADTDQALIMPVSQPEPVAAVEEPAMQPEQPAQESPAQAIFKMQREERFGAPPPERPRREERQPQNGQRDQNRQPRQFQGNRDNRDRRDFSREQQPRPERRDNGSTQEG